MLDNVISLIYFTARFFKFSFKITKDWHMLIFSFIIYNIFMTFIIKIQNQNLERTRFIHYPNLTAVKCCLAHLTAFCIQV